jgi:hypothetical protein
MGILGQNNILPQGAAATDMSSLSFISFTASMQALGIAEISVGATHACAVFSSGSSICWGENSSGELGAEVVTGINLGNGKLVNNKKKKKKKKDSSPWTQGG